MVAGSKGKGGCVRRDYFGIGNYHIPRISLSPWLTSTHEACLVSLTPRHSLPCTHRRFSQYGVNWQESNRPAYWSRINSLSRYICFPQISSELYFFSDKIKAGYCKFDCLIRIQSLMTNKIHYVNILSRTIKIFQLFLPNRAACETANAQLTSQLPSTKSMWCPIAPVFK